MREILLITLLTVALLPIMVLLFINLYLLDLEEKEEKSLFLHQAARQLNDNHKKVMKEAKDYSISYSNLFKRLKYDISYSNKKELKEFLLHLNQNYKADILTITDPDGVVLARINSNHSGDRIDFSKKEKKILQHDSLVSVELIDDKDLGYEGKKLVNRTRVLAKHLKLPDGTNFEDPEKGIFVFSATPIFSLKTKNKLDGILIFGILMDQEYLRTIQGHSWSPDLFVELVPANTKLDESFNVVVDYLKNIRGRSVAKFVVWFDPDKVNPILSKQQSTYLLITAIVALIALLSSIVISGVLVKPIVKLNKSSNEVAKGNYDENVLVKGPAEIEELSQSFNKMLVALAEKRQMQKDFIATLTHDMRVPLYAEQKVLNIILGEPKYQDFKNQKVLIEQLLISNEGLLTLVNTLLDTFKFEEGKYKLNLAEYNIKNLFDECLQMLKPLADEKNQVIVFNSENDIIDLNFDRSEMKRVICNLMSNAIKFTPEQGKIEIKLYSQTDNICFYIKDNGIGMSADEVSKLFTRYSSGAKKLKKIGTGLGLYLSYCIVQSHNGTMTAKSEPGEGSTFYVTLPDTNRQLNSNQEQITNN